MNSFIGFLIEHHPGSFPLRLAPEQVRVFISGNEGLVNYGKPIVTELRANFVGCETDLRTDPRKAKIAEAGVFEEAPSSRVGYEVGWPECVRRLCNGRIF